MMADDRLLEGQDLQELVLPVQRRDRIVEVLDVVDADEVGRQLEELGVAQVAAREALNPFGHRRREEQRLPLGRRLLQDVLDVLLKAHREHLVALVEDRAADPVEPQRPAPQVIEHAPGRAADDLAAGVQLLDLPAHRRAAVDRDDRDLPVGADPRQLGGDLQRQLARRQKDDRLHELVLRPDDVVGEGDAEGGGLPRAGARLDHQVASRRR